LTKKRITILALLFNSFFFASSAGINVVSFPLVLYQNNVSFFLIGIVGAIEVLAGVLVAKFLYGFGKKVGVLKVIIAFSVLESLVILLLPLYYNIAWWIFLVSIFGVSWFSIITLCQSWLNMIIDDKQRSMVLALHSTMLCAGFALGPVVVKIIGAGQYLLFVISAILVCCSFLSLLLLKSQQPKLEEQKIDYLQIIKTHKSSFITRFLLDLQIIVVTMFTVFYGIKNGLTAENAGMLVSVFMVIGLADLLIGWKIKNKNLQKLTNFGFVGLLLAILVLPFVIHQYWLAILVFIVYGWFTSIVFIAVITRVNHNQNKKDLIAINAVFQAIGGLGAVFGNLLAGILMQVFDANGFVILILLANLAYFGFVIFGVIKSK
jgi:MFS family permease